MSPLLLRVARPNVFSSSKSFCVIRIKKDTKEAMASTSRPESKVILCGEYGVGKSSIFRRFANDSFVDLTNKSTAECRQSTLGLDCISRTFDVPGFRPVRVQLWDTGGLERVASVTTSYYKFAGKFIPKETFHNHESINCNFVSFQTHTKMKSLCVLCRLKISNRALPYDRSGYSSVQLKLTRLVSCVDATFT